MPRIPDPILASVFYLYQSEDDARKGSNQGGTGFLISWPSSVRGYGWLYGVSNKHVVHIGNAPVMRLNTKDGSHDVLAFGREQWIPHPDGDDVAMCQIGYDAVEHCNYQPIPIFYLTDDRDIKSLDIGPGDDVFMIGRFRGSEGVEVNRPIVRFGNISAMPDERHQIVQRITGIKHACYIVEMRSLSGFSGSPVFTYLPQQRGRYVVKEELQLIGIDCGQINWYAPVLDTTEEAPAPIKGMHVEVATNFCKVIPTNKIVELLLLPEFKEPRDQQDKQLKEMRDKGLLGQRREE